MLTKAFAWIENTLSKWSDKSAQKLTALALICCVFYIHIAYVRTGNCIEALLADLFTICVLLGISKWDEKFNTPQPTTRNTDETSNAN